MPEAARSFPFSSYFAAAALPMIVIVRLITLIPGRIGHSSRQAQENTIRPPEARPRHIDGSGGYSARLSHISPARSEEPRDTVTGLV